MSILVGMVLDSHLTIRFLNLILGRCGRYLEQVVVLCRDRILVYRNSYYIFDNKSKAQDFLFSYHFLVSGKFWSLHCCCCSLYLYPCYLPRKRPVCDMTST